MEIEPKRQGKDGLAILLSGGVIGIIGAIAEGNISSFPNSDLIGVILAVTGVAIYRNSKRAPGSGGE